MSGPRIVDRAYLIKWAGYTHSDNTWEPRSNLPDSVFEDEAESLSYPFEVIATNTQNLNLTLTLTSTLTLTLKVIATKTALANAATLARHKLTMTPIPTKAGVSSESSPEVASSKDEWAPSSQETITDVDEISGGEISRRN